MDNKKSNLPTDTLPENNFVDSIATK